MNKLLADNSNLRNPRRLAFIAVLLCALPGCCKCASNRPNPKETSKSQAVSLFDLDGKPTDLWRQSSAVTVAIFVRSDCPISNRYAPEIRRLYDKYHSQGVEFFLIYVDPSEQPEAIRRHLREYEYQCAGLRDPKHTLVALCGATTTPEAVVFDKSRAITYLGRIDDLYQDVGRPRSEPTTHDLADAIESTIQGRPVAQPRTKAVGCLIADLKD